MMAFTTKCQGNPSNIFAVAEAVVVTLLLHTG